jgi:hypothetical protein
MPKGSKADPTVARRESKNVPKKRQKERRSRRSKDEDNVILLEYPIWRLNNMTKSKKKKPPE